MKNSRQLLLLLLTRLPLTIGSCTSHQFEPQASTEADSCHVPGDLMRNILND
jgi:hypothetical protein